MFPSFFQCVHRFAHQAHAYTQEQEAFVMDNSQYDDDAEFNYHIALKSEHGTLVHEVHVHFHVRYSLLEDMKRWLPAGVFFLIYQNCD